MPLWHHVAQDGKTRRTVYTPLIILKSKSSFCSTRDFTAYQNKEANGRARTNANKMIANWISAALFGLIH